MSVEILCMQLQKKEKKLFQLPRPLITFYTLKAYRVSLRHNFNKTVEIIKQGSLNENYCRLVKLYSLMFFSKQSPILLCGQSEIIVFQKQ